MKFIIGMYIILICFMAVNFISILVFNDTYSGIALWVCVLLFLIGTVFYINARNRFSKGAP